METRAAVAHKAGEQLKIETVRLDGPRVGEVLVEIKATGICHTDAYTLSGADPEAPSLTYHVYERPYGNALVLYKPLSYGGASGTLGDATATTHALGGAYPSVYPLRISRAMRWHAWRPSC